MDANVLPSADAYNVGRSTNQSSAHGLERTGKRGELEFNPESDRHQVMLRNLAS